tara:strand:- start:1815 stop:4151 length:2337 start_codon:yes stop_codon:yes gene_type:complete
MMSIKETPEFKTHKKNDSHTISFKVGRAILDAKSLKGFVQLPYKLYEAREIHLERQYDCNIADSLKNNGFESVSKVYQEFGVRGLAYLSQIQKIDKEEFARELISLSKNIKGDDRLLISLLALEFDSSLPVLRGAAWSGVHCNNISIIEEVLNKLQNDSSFKKDQYQKTYKEFLSKIPKIQRQNETENNRLKYFNETKALLANKIFGLNTNSLLTKVSKSELLFEKLVSSLYLMGGVKGVKKGIDQLFFSFNSRQKAFLYLKAGKFLNKISTNAEYELAKMALEVSEHISILRGALWATQRKGDFNKTAEIIEKIETKIPKKLSKSDNTFLDKVYKSPAYTLTIEKHIESKENYDIKPVKGRIAYILHNSLPFSSGGYATRGYGLSIALKDLGYDVHVINRPGFPVDLGNELVPSEIGEISIIDDIPHIRILEPTRRGKRPYDYMLEAADALEIRFREYRPEIVVAASNHITAIPALIAASRLGIPFIYEVRGFWEITRVSREPEFEHKAAFKVQVLLEAMAAKRSRHVFTLTQPMKDELIRRGIEGSKVTLLPNSCNPYEFIPRGRNQDLAKKLDIPNTVPVIGYIGTFVQYEGLEHLVEACGLLKQKGIEFRLLIVGNENASGTDRGPITEAIIETAEANNMTDWVILPGRVPHDEVSDYYSLIDITPFPRKPQPVTEMVSPMKPLEAAAMKKAIVVSSVKALKEMIVHEGNGLIFEKGNISDLATQLERLISNDELRIKLGDSAREWVETERTWQITAKKMDDILKGSLNESKSR